MAWQRTKIVCTLGPATDTPGILEGLVRGGMDMARINLSHGTHCDHRRRIQRVREVSRDLGQPVGILADLPGPKFRVGELPGGSRKLLEGTRVFLTEDESAPDVLPIRHRGLLEALHPGERVYLADGSIELRVMATDAGRVECEVLVG
ncbi:MAG: pyruvate kinase, partial [Gammaproteobacteria bacterium]